ncbi:glycoside hydrolase family 5 protein [Sphingomonas rhizophila]|uniref:Glycoside hydrolase family 5 protein n=2 Tax=Sphingomonas rhizophila TaxID=2071607 RepID=A0A7G9SE35_9SPHN|nr:glycoside hydrolase family 5 protein [Sphingomonas rhizophila]
MPGAAAAKDAPAASEFRRGVNVLGYDPYWKHEASARFQWRHFAALKSAGFDHVRLNLFVFDKMDSKNRLPEAWLRKLDRVVDEASKAGLGIILDEHDFNACAKDVATCRVKLGAFWEQVAPRYRSRPASVAFELLNEPHAKLDAAAWNTMLVEMLAIVRRSNPTRKVIIGPTSWNSFRELPSLKLPADDRNLIVTFHYYDPFRFTHQGASWTDLQELRGVTWGSEADHRQLSEDFAKVADWAKANNRPIYLGEFGAYDKSGTPTDQRVAWTSAVAREAEKNGFTWAYWQFDSDFLLWDMKADRFVEPIRGALIPR